MPSWTKLQPCAEAACVRVKSGRGMGGRRLITSVVKVAKSYTHLRIDLHSVDTPRLRGPSLPSPLARYYPSPLLPSRPPLGSTREFWSATSTAKWSPQRDQGTRAHCAMGDHDMMHMSRGDRPPVTKCPDRSPIEAIDERAQTTDASLQKRQQLLYAPFFFGTHTGGRLRREGRKLERLRERVLFSRRTLVQNRGSASKELNNVDPERTRIDAQRRRSEEGDIPW